MSNQPLDVIIVGNNLNSRGLVGANFSTSGLGLVTRGFLFPCDGHWTPFESSITTTWTNCLDADTVEECTD